MIKSLFRAIVGTANDRELKKYQKKVAKINALEPKYEKMSDDELKNAFNELKEQVQSGSVSLDDVLLTHLQLLVKLPSVLLACAILMYS